MAQLVKDLALSLQWLGLMLWCGFDLWPRNVHVLQAQPKKKKELIFFLKFGNFLGALKVLYLIKYIWGEMYFNF